MAGQTTAGSDVWDCGRCALRPPAKKRSRREQSSPCGVRCSNAPANQPPVSQRLNLWGAQAAATKTPSFLPSRTTKTAHLKSKCAHPCRPTTFQWRLISRFRRPPPPNSRSRRLVPASPRLALPRSAPSTCGEDAESDERLADHVTPALGTELDAAREEFPGADQVRWSRAAPLWPGGLREERVELTARRDQSRQLRWQLWCLAALGEAVAVRRVSCVPCGARHTSAPSQLPEPRARLYRRQTPPTWPSCEDRATHWPSPSLRTSPRSPGPGRPLLDSGR